MLDLSKPKSQRRALLERLSSVPEGFPVTPSNRNRVALCGAGLASWDEATWVLTITEAGREALRKTS